MGKAEPRAQGSAENRILFGGDRKRVAAGDKDARVHGPCVGRSNAEAVAQRPHGASCLATGVGGIG